MIDFEEVVRFHGHACPGLAYGFRAAQAALTRLGGQRARDEGLVAVVENRSCAVDAIQVVCGCTFGKGNLLLNDYGKQVYTIMRRQDGQAVRLAVSWQQPPEPKEIKELFSRMNQGIASPEDRRQLQAHKGAKMKAILQASEGELFTISEDQLELPPMARVFPSLRCSRCGEKVMEPMAKEVGGQRLCLPCFNDEPQISEPARLRNIES